MNFSDSNKLDFTYFDIYIYINFFSISIEKLIF